MLATVDGSLAGWLRLRHEADRSSRTGASLLEEFYRRLGWEEIGRWPNALRFSHGDRDEILMLLTPL